MLLLSLDGFSQFGSTIVTRQRLENVRAHIEAEDGKDDTTYGAEGPVVSPLRRVASF